MEQTNGKLHASCLGTKPSPEQQKFEVVGSGMNLACDPHCILQ